jgi:hypothetical protein
MNALEHVSGRIIDFSERIFYFSGSSTEVKYSSVCFSDPSAYFKYSSADVKYSSTEVKYSSAGVKYSPAGVENSSAGVSGRVAGASERVAGGQFSPSKLNPQKRAATTVIAVGAGLVPARRILATGGLRTSLPLQFDVLRLI